MKNESNSKVVGIEHMFHVLTSPRWITLMLIVPLLVLAVAHFALAQTADSGTVKFDHVKTGFNLTGSHVQARCGSCHIQSLFKGTPRDCASCHMIGNRMGAMAKPDKHIITTAKCDSCHKTTVWTDATFSHVGLAPGSCLTCHNSTTATGKPSGHVPSVGSCDSCHKTIGWRQVVFSHTGIVSGCVNCHSGQSFNGVTPMGQSANHQATQADCSTCHTSTTTFKSAAGATLPANHLPTMQSCGICHNIAAFNPGVMNHMGIRSGCASCHNGQSFLGVTPVSKTSLPTHIVTAADCSTCHTSTTTFLLAAGATMPAGHLPSQMACSTCHSSFGPSSGVMNHTGIVSGCASCHGGQPFTGVTPVSKPSTHLTTSATCETCHSATKFTTFSGTTMNHQGILSGCASCHNGQVFFGVTPVSKASYASHVVTSADCSTCHTSTVTFVTSSAPPMPLGHLTTAQPCAICHSSFGPGSGVMNHLGILSGCASCHTGQTLYGVTQVSKPTNHLLTSQPCETCHSASKFTTFSGTLMIHTGIVSGCASCHTGQVFAGVTPVPKPVNHLSTSATCETCHSATKFTTFSGTTMNHLGILSGCASCHNNQVFAGVTPVSKTSFPSHIVTAADCSTCHTSTLTFVTSATTMPTNHLPTTQACATCHSSFGANSGVMNHLGIVSGCASCHGGQSFIGVTPVPKPVNHLTTSATCETCHSASKFTTFSGTLMIHTGILGGCASCHTGQAFAGVTPVSKPANHLLTSQPCETCHSASKFTTFSGTLMIHTGIVSGCASCHSGQAFAGVTPVSKPVNHVSTSAACETCHSSSAFTTFSGTAMNHLGIVNNCALCHTGQAFAGGTPVSKSSMHIPYATGLLGGASMGCEFCHTSTVMGGFLTSVSSTTMHNGSQGMGSGSCVACHLSGTSYTGTAQKMSHNGASAAKDCSSSGCHRPLGNTGSSYTNWGG